MIVDGVRMQNGERRVGLKAGEGQAFEWRKRHSESNGTFGSGRADLGTKIIVFKYLQADRVEEGLS